MDITNDWWPKFSEAEYQRRDRLVRDAMAARGIDCLFVYGGATYFGTDPGCKNMVWLSNYAPCYHGYVVFPQEGDPTLIIFASVHAQNARDLSVIADVRGSGDICAGAIERLRELGCDRGKIGIVGNVGWPSVSIPFEHHQALTTQLPQAQIEVVTEWYEELKLRKSPEEIRYMEAGAAICDAAHEAVRAMAGPGVSDNDLHNEALRVVHALGGRTAFGHVGSTPMHNPNMSYPSYYPLNRVIQQGDAIMTELTGGYGGHMGKMFATLFVGKPTAEYRQMFELAAEIYHQLHATIKPGIRGRDLEPVLAGRAAEFGYKSLSFIDGWSTHNTRPSLLLIRVSEADRQFELQPDLCLSVTGWVVSPDHRMGVWIGDTSVVTADGVRNLQAYPLDQLEYVTVG